jgi:hypothetical protein
LQYTILNYFKHAAQTALFASTQDSFYIIIKADVNYYHVMAWKTKKLPFTRSDMRPLHFRKKNSGLLLYESVVQLLQSFRGFQLSGIIQTSLNSIDALRNVVVSLCPFDVSRLQFDATIPAFVLPKDGFVLPDVLGAPFVMLVNGSTTPDPRMYHSGTQSLWNTITGNRVAALSKLRYGVLLQQTKTNEQENDRYTVFEVIAPSVASPETKSDNEQFICDV